MLLQLEISNIALIDNICVKFKNGMNVLTGETGAGKSIIIDSINAILGSRMSREIIRTGQDSAQVTAIFVVENKELEEVLIEAGIEPEEDGSLIISRELNVKGPNICRVNSKVVTLSYLKKLGDYLIDIHGQHDNQSLLKTETHIKLLDSFCGDEFQDLLIEYRGYYEEYKELIKQITYFNSNETEKERRKDLLNYQIEEIESAKLKPGEDDELMARKNIIQQSERISTSLNNAYEELYGGKEQSLGNEAPSAYDKIALADREISSISNVDERFQNLSTKLNELLYGLQELTDELRNELDLIDFDPDEIDYIEERLDLIFRLKRKYGSTIEEILEYYAKAKEELDSLVNSEATAEKLYARLNDVKDKLSELAKQITNKRLCAAEKLKEGIVANLIDLEMKNVNFEIKFEEYGEFTSNGLDKVEFLVSTNLGEPPKPLSKIASGGEMSRIMLAIKTMLASYDNIPTMIFDEIDTGISGLAATKVAEKMKCLSKVHQVIAVTHLPQIAVCADNNIFVEKTTSGKNTLTKVKSLEDDDLVREIARLLDGSKLSDITLAHAKEMLKNAKTS